MFPSELCAAALSLSSDGLSLRYRRCCLEPTAKGRCQPQWGTARRLAPRRAGTSGFCCKTANRGCPSELPPPSGLPPSGEPPAPDSNVYDCDAGYHHCMHCLVLSWSPEKIKYCCANFHKGCRGEEPE